jgi:hypothetical protein
MTQLVTGLRTDAAGPEIFASGAVHELMAPLVAAQSCARLARRSAGRPGQASGHDELA